MRSTAFVCLASLSSVALGAPIAIRAASQNVVTVLQFAHVLEQLETSFYTQALQKFQPSDFNAAGFNDASIPMSQFTLIKNDEATHVKVLESQLVSFGAQPISGCNFDFSSVLTDVKTMAGAARLVENVGVSAYLGAAALLDDPQILTDAATIATVEARHQTMLNLFNGGTSIATPFDLALSPTQVATVVAPFIQGCDLGIPSGPALSVSNQGPITPGAQLNIAMTNMSSSASANMTCQMLVGGQVFAIAQPVDNCIVPNNIDGLVYLFVTKTNQPLLVGDISNQFAADIVAGPMGMFVDTGNSPLSKLFTSGASGAVSNGPPSNGTSSTGGSSDNGGGNGDGNSNGTGSSSTPSSTDPNATASAIVSTTTLSPDAASSLISSMSAASGASAPTGVPANVGASQAQQTGQAGAVEIIGWSSIAATALSSEIAFESSVSASLASATPSASGSGSGSAVSATATASVSSSASLGSSSATATATDSASATTSTSTATVTGS